MENPAANVVKAAINTAEPTRDTDSFTRAARSASCSLNNKRQLLISKEIKISLNSFYSIKKILLEWFWFWFDSNVDDK